MIQAHTIGALLALGALTALPGCSAFGGGDSGHQYSQARPQAAPSAYGAEEAGARPPVTARMIQNVQHVLAQDGTYRGGIDGIWGPGSTQAMMTYQRDHNLRANGQIDLPTLDAMNLRSDHGQSNQANAGSNGDMANGGRSTNGPGTMQSDANPNYTTGGQNPPGSSNASNLPAPGANQPDNGMSNGTANPNNANPTPTH